MPDKLKKGCLIWRFDQMAVMVNDRIDDPSKAKVEHYVGLEHLDSDSLTIRRWGSPEDVEATKLRFRAGDIIFGRRRAYQRKLGVAHFDGICSAHAMVLRAKPDVALPEFLPFFMQSDLFMERAKQISVGSLSPTINWKHLAAEEFALPPLDEQRRIAEVLNLVEVSCAAFQDARDAIEKARVRYSLDVLSGVDSLTRDARITTLGEVAFIIMGQSPAGNTYNATGSGIPLLNGPTEFGEVYPTAQQFTTQATKFCDKGDILFCVRGSTTGRRNLADKRYCIGRGLAAIRARVELSDISYLGVLLEGLEFIVFHEAKGAGSTFPNIDSTRLHAQKVRLPELNKQLIVGRRHTGMSARLAHIKQRLSYLQAIKQNIMKGSPLGLCT